MNHQRNRGSNYKQQLNAVYINKIVGHPQELYPLQRNNNPLLKITIRHANTETPRRPLRSLLEVKTKIKELAMQYARQSVKRVKLADLISV